MPLNKNENFRQPLEQIARSKSSIVSVFSDFVKMAACAVANQTREDEYLQTIQSYDKDELHELCKAFGYLVNEMQDNPFSDILGQYYQEIASKVTRDHGGEFYTPEAISALMAKITVDAKSVIDRGLPITVNEPACGGGGMILQLAKQFSPLEIDGDKSYVDLLRVTLQDISPIAVDMAYVNTTLYGIPSRIVLGNVLSAEYRKEWKNIHWFRVGEDERIDFKKLFAILDADPESPKKTPEDESPKIDIHTHIDLGELKQGSFEF